MEMYNDGVKVYVFPDCAMCKADILKRNPLDIEVCPWGYETCVENCYYYEENF